MNSLEQFTLSFHELTETSLQRFKDAFVIKNFKKGDIVAGSHQQNDVFLILKEGIASSYIIDDKGKERLRTLFTPMTIIASIDKIMKRPLANAEYKCLTDCTFYTSSLKQVLELQNECHDISLLFNRISEEYYAAVISRINSLTLLDAKERYLLLKKTFPTIESHIPLYQIASYLNITPIQLSRVRKEIYSRKKATY